MKSRRSIYIKAAKLIDKQEQYFSCLAVDEAVDPYNVQSPERDLYSVVMSPNGWGGLCITDIDKATYEGGLSYEQGKAARRNFRVMLLLMMAACCDDMPEDFTELWS